MGEESTIPPTNDRNPEASSGERLAQLTQSSRPNRSKINYTHTRLVKRLRLIFPIIALSLIAILIIWPEISEEKAIPVQKQERSEQTIGENELVNPRFESTDNKKQPYTITAASALQGKENENLVMLDKPVADILLNNGNWLAIQADKGAFREDTQRLLLQGNVKMFHDLGYELTTPQLHVDMNEEYIWSESNIYAQGPAGTLEAKGMKVYTKNGQLIFTGPAKLTLNKALKGLN